jgi:hypothetical protein
MSKHLLQQTFSNIPEGKVLKLVLEPVFGCHQDLTTSQLLKESIHLGVYN